MLTKKYFVLPVVLVLSVFALTACGSAFVDALNPAIDEFNSAANDFNDQLEIVNRDNDKFTDPEWIASTETTLATLRGAGQALRNLPETDSNEYDRLNGLVQQLADATINFVDRYRAAIAAGDIFLTDDADPYLDLINELLPQINAEISRLDS